MAIIYDSENFIVESHESPEVDRLEGGHMKISPKMERVDRTELSVKEAIELMRLTIVSGIAMKEGMRNRGIEIGRINYQDNGNWKPQLHVHLYGRAVGAVMQKYGDPIAPGHREGYHSLDAEDIAMIRGVMEKLFLEERFSDRVWKL